MLVIDAANVVGSRPTGWWRDRAGAARLFVAQVRDAAGHGQLPSQAVIVLEGAARAGAAETESDGVRVVHAPHHGDDELVAQIATSGDVLVTADRQLRARVHALGAQTVSPSWLYDRLDATRSHGGTPQQ